MKSFLLSTWKHPRSKTACFKLNESLLWSFCNAGHAQEGGSESNGMNEEGQGAGWGRGEGGSGTCALAPSAVRSESMGTFLL